MIRHALALAALLAAFSCAAADRVVTLAPHLTELACAAGGCGKLVGVSAWSDYPPGVEKLPQVGDAFAVNLESLLALQPDLVLAWEGGTSPQIVERLQALKLRVELVRVRKLDEIAGALENVGALLNTGATAQAAAVAYRTRLRALRERYRHAQKLRVLYQIDVEPLYTVNRDSPISEAITVCGGENVFAGLPQLAAPVNKEAVLKSDPEVIVFGQEEGAAIRAWWSRWPQVRAVKNGNLYTVNASLLARATPRMLDGVEQLCAALDQARKK